VQLLLFVILSRTPWKPVADPLWSADPSLKTAGLGHDATNTTQQRRVQTRRRKDGRLARLVSEDEGRSAATSDMVARVVVSGRQRSIATEPKPVIDRV